MAVPTIPASAKGVSKTRSSPNFTVRPSVTRKTPPNGQTSSPITSTVSSSARLSERAWFSACAMVIGVGGTSISISSLIGAPGKFEGQLGTLGPQGGGGLAVDETKEVLRIGVHIVVHPFPECGCKYFRLVADRRQRVVIQKIAVQQVPLQSVDGVPVQPRSDFLGGAVPGGIVSV